MVGNEMEPSETEQDGRPLIDLVDPAKRYTTKEVAGMLNVRPSTLRSWRRKGRGPAVDRFGGSVRYPGDGLIKYLRAVARKAEVQTERFRREDEKTRAALQRRTDEPKQEQTETAAVG